jgi:hypothetical protein
VVGLSQNPSVTADELLPFVYATVQPFVGSQTIASVVEEEDLEKSNDDDETVYSYSKPKAPNPVNR